MLNGVTPPTDTVGSNGGSGPPNWTYNITFGPGASGNPFSTPARYNGVLNDMGTRDSEITSTSARLLVGASYTWGDWDLDSGVTIARSDAAVRDFERYLAQVPEVVDFTSYVGVASPMDFNGLVRHYYLRRGDNVAEVRVDLATKKARWQQSHAIGLRLRDPAPTSSWPLRHWRRSRRTPHS